VAAGDEEPERGVGDGGVLEEAGLEMGLEVVDAEEGLLVVISQAFDEREADEEEPMSPGPWVTAKRSISATPTPARERASPTMGVMDLMCWREASSGTTPPYGAWTSSWDRTTLLRISGAAGGHVPSVRVPLVGSGARRTAAEVSSQDVSIARTSTSPPPFPLILTEMTRGVRPATKRKLRPPSHVPLRPGASPLLRQDTPDSIRLRGRVGAVPPSDHTARCDAKNLAFFATSGPGPA